MLSGSYVSLRWRDPRHPARRRGVPIPAVVSTDPREGHSLECYVSPRFPRGWTSGGDGAMRLLHRVPARLAEASDMITSLPGSVPAGNRRSGFSLFGDGDSPLPFRGGSPRRILMDHSR
jgi:hypothetical protein